MSISSYFREGIIEKMNHDPHKPSEIPPLPCAEKLFFTTRAEAQAAATVTAHRYGTQLKVYKCRYCQGWHLSST